MQQEDYNTHPEPEPKLLPEIPLWKAILKCRDCGHILNTAEHVPETNKGVVSFTAAFNAGRCPNGCRSTFSDLNLNTELVWEREPHTAIEESKNG
jgi:heterodisulfide reductase subunit B